MPRLVKLLQLSEVSHNETPNEILLETSLDTELHIISKNDITIIKFPYGNKFDIVNGEIIIKGVSKARRYGIR